jgi:hypothetical protein
VISVLLGIPIFLVGKMVWIVAASTVLSFCSNDYQQYLKEASKAQQVGRDEAETWQKIRDIIGRDF